MTLFLKSRGVGGIFLALLVTLAGVYTPVAQVAGAAGPLGAQMALGIVLALILPATLAWGCGRGATESERMAVRNPEAMDLLLVACSIGVAAVGTAASYEVAGSVGLVVSRALLTFGGLVLLAWSTDGWDTAAILPVVYFLAVAIAGRGSDAGDPAPWAWIAAAPADRWAWTAAATTSAGGVVISGWRVYRSR